MKHTVVKSICKLIFLSSLTATLASCESRSGDVFRSLDGGPSVQFSEDGVNYSKSVGVSLRSGEDAILHYRLEGEYPYDVTHLLRLDEYLYSPADSTEKTSKTEDVMVRVNTADSTIIISSLRSRRTWTESETYKRLTLNLSARDVYGKVDSALVKISISSFRGLTAQASAVEFDPSDSLKVTVRTASEPNDFGDTAEKWEYLFDGTIMYDADGWETADRSSYNANAGQAARDGYYITATNLTSVSHQFQSGGVHTLAVRCKSSSGMWGRWTRYTISVKDKSYTKM